MELKVGERYEVKYGFRVVSAKIDGIYEKDGQIEIKWHSGWFNFVVEDLNYFKSRLLGKEKREITF